MDLSKKQFGGNAKKWESLYKTSSRWTGKKFENVEPIKLGFSLQTVPKFFYKQVFDKEGREPQASIPILPFDENKFLKAKAPQFIWYGHSVLLMRIDGLTIMIDPMMGPNASPPAPITTKRFSDDAIEILKQLPPIDLVLITHDHYDHLDWESIEIVKNKCDTFYVAMGVERHLISWGIDKEKITSFDWWTNTFFKHIDITFTPTQHASGRGISDQSKCLWGGWALKTKETAIYFSGDGGYNKHFKEVGKRLGPFDIGFMECGQYNDNWKPIHMTPEEAIKAAMDTKVKKAIPVHWAGFALAQHHWKEPVERFTKAAIQKGQNFITPQIGQQFNLDSTDDTKWWEDYE